ncbi:hypothetical protein [Leptospira yasudae]|uniref:Uncharacterized protein n=1 Tax=Leptospira yasudae TaxID=2202201 RepID=A0A6N4QSR7_9LEPT|nr:hypothetical protein [Leptospira yasudae]TGL76730.1 hypothetical protein EHQ72_12935 [Leptospira yasudae]TGL82017.1 hypothetical protein EHQ83_14405 [Leptospira yasudae]TGL84163.1 hypothetical protein EHQ77_00390 [Leptospira yasudae]
MQPTIEFPTTIKHLYGELFLNLWLSDRADRDNEQRILQSKSGRQELFFPFENDLQTGNFCPSPTTCYTPYTVGKYVNQNGMARNNAGEFTLFYDFEKSKRPFYSIKTQSYVSYTMDMCKIRPNFTAMTTLLCMTEFILRFRIRTKKNL